MSRNIVCYGISQITRTEERKSNGTCGKYREVHVLGILEALADWVGVNQEEWSVTFQKLQFKIKRVYRPAVHWLSQRDEEEPALVRYLLTFGKNALSVWQNVTVYSCMGRDSSVGRAPRYGLDGPGINSRLGDIFRTRPGRPWGPPNLLYNGNRVFPGVKAAGAWIYHPTPSSTKVKGGVELYMYSHSGPSWPLLGWTLHSYILVSITNLKNNLFIL